MAPFNEPRISTIQQKWLVGKHLTMSFADYKIAELWRMFMPHCGVIAHRISDDLLSVAIYQPDHFAHFSPVRTFERWAAAEVSQFESIPDGLDTYILPSGLYAVFDYKGYSSDNAIYQYIFGTWLPSSGYQLDHRPHFEILGENYKNNDPNSEEEIWIPIKQ